jgi:hypothetical protein
MYAKAIILLVVASLFVSSHAFLGVEFANLPFDISVCDSDPFYDPVDVTQLNTGAPQLHDSGVICFTDVVSCVACLEYLNMTYSSTLQARGPIDINTNNVDFIDKCTNPNFGSEYINPRKMVNTATYSTMANSGFPFGSGASFGILMGPLPQGQTYFNYSNIYSSQAASFYPSADIPGQTCNVAAYATFLCTNPQANIPAFTDPSNQFYTGKAYPNGHQYFGCRAVFPNPNASYNYSNPLGPTRNFSYEGQLIGDPHFLGFDGSKFDFFGVPNEWFNIITDATFQLNAFLVSYGGENSYMTKLGFTSGNTRISYDTKKNLTVNGEPVKSSFSNQDISISTEGSYTIFQTPVYKIKVKVAENADGQFLNVRSSIISMPGRPHGVLGQTAKFLVDGNKPQPRKATNKQGAGVIEGNFMDYLVRDGQFGKDFRFNHFTGSPEAEGFNRRRSVVEVSAKITNK